MTPTTASSRAKWRLVTLPPWCPVTARCPECGGQAGGGRQGGDGAARAPPRLHPLGQAQGPARGGLLEPRLLPGDILLLQLPHLSNTTWASPSTMKTSPALSSPSRSGGEQISQHNTVCEGLMRLARETGHNPVREEQFLLPGLGQQTCSSPLDPELRISHWMSVSLLPSVKISSPAARSSPDTLQALPMPGKSFIQVGAACRAKGIRFKRGELLCDPERNPSCD